MTCERDGGEVNIMEGREREDRPTRPEREVEDGMAVETVMEQEDTRRGRKRK